jgi:hypothetical protein
MHISRIGSARWSLIFFLLAAVSPALPWAVVAGAPVDALRGWHGPAITTAGVFGFFLGLAALSIAPAPRWLNALSAATALFIAVIFVASIRDWRQFPPAERGALLCLVAVAGLLVTSVVEFAGRRSPRAKRHPNPKLPAPHPAAR